MKPEACSQPGPHRHHDLWSDGNGRQRRESYADVTSKQNEEAIEVLKTVGIMVGDENGKFNPGQGHP
ncbi:MAG: S-layer homology domain-containing protein [Oscillospiraceae bacterium]